MTFAHMSSLHWHQHIPCQNSDLKVSANTLLLTKISSTPILFRTFKMPFQQSVWAIIVFLYYKTRSSLIHFASIVAAPPRLFTVQNSQGGATPMQAKRIKLDLRISLLPAIREVNLSHFYLFYHFSPFYHRAAPQEKRVDRLDLTEFSWRISVTVLTEVIL